jgi:hypothetical protein
MLHIFTIASDKNKLQYLSESEKNHSIKINYVLLDKWNGHYDKLMYMKNCIQDIPPDDIVCFIDAYDVLINSNEYDIIKNFKHYNCNILVGAELNCFPGDYKEKIDNINTNFENFYKYINSGGYIGYSKYLKEMLYWKNDEEIKKICTNGGDQTYLIEYYLENYMDKNVAMDIYCKVFQNMHWVDWNSIIFKNGIVYNTVMDTNSSFIHFNGGTFQTMERENIMPIFLKKIQESKHVDNTLNLNNYKQIITETCFPHKQK